MWVAWGGEELSVNKPKKQRQTKQPQTNANNQTRCQTSKQGGAALTMLLPLRLLRKICAPKHNEDSPKKKVDPHFVF